MFVVYVFLDVPQQGNKNITLGQGSFSEQYVKSGGVAKNRHQ